MPEWQGGPEGVQREIKAWIEDIQTDPLNRGTVAQQVVVLQALWGYAESLRSGERRMRLSDLLGETEKAARGGHAISDSLAHAIAQRLFGPGSPAITRFFRFGDMPGESGGPEGFQTEVAAMIERVQARPELYDEYPGVGNLGTAEQHVTMLQALLEYAEAFRVGGEAPGVR